jgi:hypothetical protein
MSSNVASLAPLSSRQGGPSDQETAGKQHLRIKQLYGTSENAVKSQIWIAVSDYVLIALVKKRFQLDASLYTLLQILSVTLFEKMSIPQAFAGYGYKIDTTGSDNQLNLFDS